jgi:hypothetical protein
MKMKFISMLYVINSTLLILHEIESAYEKEWEILKLPGKITGFLLLHIPIVVLIFYGLIEVEKLSTIGFVFGIITGIGGVIPFIVHKIIVRRNEHFNLIISNAIINLNVLSGICLFLLSVRYFV